MAPKESKSHFKLEDPKQKEQQYENANPINRLFSYHSSAVVALIMQPRSSK
jgi:hypothetical protein